VGVVVDECDCPAQPLGLRGKRLGVVPHWPVGIPAAAGSSNALAAYLRPDTICP
jgi:hypothetical protein